MSPAHGGVVNQCPIATVALVADEKVESGEHGGEKTRNFRKAWRLSEFQSTSVNLGQSVLGGKTRVLSSIFDRPVE